MARWRWVAAGCALALVLGLGWWGLGAIRGARQRAALAEAQRDGQYLVVAGLQGALARATLVADSFRTVVAGAHATGGTVTHAVVVTVPGRDTAWLADTLATLRAADGARTATFADSTGRTAVRAQVTAPPGDAALVLDTLEIRERPIRLEVGFLKVGDSTIAVASTDAGDSVRVGVPYAKAPAKAARGLPTLGGFWELNYDLANRAQLRAGGVVRAGPRWTVQAVVDQDAPLDLKDFRGPKLLVGVRHDW